MNVVFFSVCMIQFCSKNNFNLGNNWFCNEFLIATYIVSKKKDFLVPQVN